MNYRLFAAALLILATSPATLTAQSNVSFELRADQTVSGGNSIVQGDFNNDGKPDIISGLFLRLGNGDGTFLAPRQIGTVGGNSGAVDTAAADLNNDGKLDLVALTPQAIVVFYGNGDGTFQPPISYTTAEMGNSVAVGDFNGDGYPDIAVGGQQGSVQIFNNVGGRSFAPASMINLGSAVVRVRAGDVDSNGTVDLAAATYQEAFVLWGDGHSNFRPVQLATYAAPQDVNIGDLNQDGSADILVSFNCGGPAPFPSKQSYNPCIGVDVFYGGQGYQATFERLALQDFGVDAATTWAVDVNGDGIADLVAASRDQNESAGGIFVWPGHPDGSFDQTAQRFIVTSDGSLVIVPGDFNRDGMMDFAGTLFSSGNTAAFINSTHRGPCATSQISPTVVVCQPVDNTYAVSPVHLQATAYDKTSVTALQEYVDNKLVYSAAVSSFNLTLTEPAGPHYLVTKAWDASGLSFRSNRRITVYNGTPGATCAAALNSASICLPGGTISSPVHIVANGYTSAVPTAAQLYVDGNLVIDDRGYCYQNGNCAGGSSSLDTYQSLPTGSHSLLFKLWDANGQSYTAAQTVQVN